MFGVPLRVCTTSAPGQFLSLGRPRGLYTQSELHDLSCFGAVCSYPLGKPLFVVKQLFAFSFSGSVLSAHPPTHGGDC